MNLFIQNLTNLTEKYALGKNLTGKISRGKIVSGKYEFEKKMVKSRGKKVLRKRLRGKFCTGKNW